MSLTIIKAGILDTIQDTGRYGFQSMGINPVGAMDRFSARLANCLLGKEMNAPVVEMHFPASIIQFNQPAIITITGADFSPAVDKVNMPLNRPVAINKNAKLQFKKVKSGARCYLSILQNFHLPKWLNSYSTNLKAEAGGFEGRALRTGDVIDFETNDRLPDFLSTKRLMTFPWHVRPFEETATDQIEVIEGKEWSLLTEKSKEIFKSSFFTISNSADRMGYRLKANNLQLQKNKQLVSSGVTFGTVQLLPNGQLIVLMADHQTTGGYPVIANVISGHLPKLAQMKPGDATAFCLTDINNAERKQLRQHQYLLSVQDAASFKIKSLFE